MTRVLRSLKLLVTFRFLSIYKPPSIFVVPCVAYNSSPTAIVEYVVTAPPSSAELLTKRLPPISRVLLTVKLEKYAFPPISTLLNPVMPCISTFP